MSLHLKSQRAALTLDYAVKLRDRGCSGQEIAEALRELQPRVKVFASMDTLEYLYKGGRLSRTAKIAGTLLGFKPIIEIADGELKLLGKGRGVKHTLDKLLDLLDERRSAVPGSTYYYGYTAVEEKCNLLRQMAAQRRHIAREVVFAC